LSGGASKMKAKDINQWLRGIIEEEAINKEGAGDK